jgi:hypothetical protein
MSLRDRDASMLLDPRFLPSEDATDGKDMDGLDDIRQEHLRHVEQIKEARDAAIAINARFQAEDTEREAAVHRAYAEGTALPSKDKRTPQSERVKQQAEAAAQLRHATDAAFEWAQAILAEMRESATDWEFAIAASQSGTRNRIEQLNIELDELKARLRHDTHLETWIKRISKSADMPGSLLPFGTLADMPDPEEAPDGTGPFAQLARNTAMAARGLPT